LSMMVRLQASVLAALCTDLCARLLHVLSGDCLLDCTGCSSLRALAAPCRKLQLSYGTQVEARESRLQSSKVAKNNQQHAHEYGSSRVQDHGWFYGMSVCRRTVGARNSGSRTNGYPRVFPQAKAGILKRTYDDIPCISRVSSSSSLSSLSSESSEEWEARLHAASYRARLDGPRFGPQHTIDIGTIRMACYMFGEEAMARMGLVQERSIWHDCAGFNG
jgi:hypothetical protein